MNQKRRGRPAYMRVRAVPDDHYLGELRARLDAPGADVRLGTIIAAVRAAPLGRHGERTTSGIVKNARAHRDFFRSEVTP